MVLRFYSIFQYFLLYSGYPGSLNPDVGDPVFLWCGNNSLFEWTISLNWKDTKQRNWWRKKQDEAPAREKPSLFRKAYECLCPYSQARSKASTNRNGFLTQGTSLTVLLEGGVGEVEFWGGWTVSIFVEYVVLDILTKLGEILRTELYCICLWLWHCPKDTR